MHKLRFRQIHMDFHNSQFINDIGCDFDKKNWQDTLKSAHVNSITCFAKCHHGLSYYDTKVGRRHPHLSFDLLRRQFDACKEIDVNVPIYLSAGVDDLVRREHPEWLEFDYEDGLAGFFDPGYWRWVCFNSPYLDYLCDQLAEVVSLFPNADGIFLDIVRTGPCCCKWCLATMDKMGLDPSVKDNRVQCAEISLANYYKRATAAVRSLNPHMPLFHNSGHISRNRPDWLQCVSHLELESLPTGDWGYDHFPLSAQYCHNLDLDFLGMTGKFHTIWGEFGGYKHPNALRYECSAMLAFGAKCSVGDQLHPRGRLDPATYRNVGQAYREVETKEPWCQDAKNVADVAILSSDFTHRGKFRENAADIGASRILLEGHLLFDVLDPQMDFSPYKLLLLPDEIRISGSLKKKIDRYLDAGGKLFLTGKSGLHEVEERFAFDIGADFSGENEYEPDYLLPAESLRPDFVDSPFVMYRKSQKIQATSGAPLGKIYNPYFNRTFKHFSSHQHTPPQSQPSQFDAGVRHGNILYLAHPVFTIYYGLGAVAYKDYTLNALRMLLNPDVTLTTNLPSTARITLTQQEAKRRYVLHLLYAPIVNRGGVIPLQHPFFKSRPINVIENLPPLHDIGIALRLPQPIKRVTLEPQGQPLPFQDNAGKLEMNLNSFACHQMISLEY